MNGNASVERSRSGATAARTSRDRGPATDSPVSPSPSTSNRTDPSAGRWWRNQREWWTSAGQRPEQVELVGLGGAGDRELADDPSRVVEHRGQRDPAGCRHPRGQQRRQPRLGARPGDPVLGVVRDLGHPDPLADGGDLLGHALPGVRAAERDVLLRLEALPLEPQRVLEAEGRAPHRVGVGQPVVDRRREQRPGGRAAPRSGT